MRGGFCRPAQTAKMDMALNSYKQTLYICIIRIAANIIMVGSVFLAMYQASRWHFWPSEAVFCMCFFGITIPVWILAWRLTKLVRKIYPAEFQSLVPIPGHGEQLVSWHVKEYDQRLSPQVN